MHATDIDILKRLRRLYLESAKERASSIADYWDHPATLAAYDAFLAERIGWKWDAVLDEIETKGLCRPVGALVDWGCGSGIAARRVVARLPVERVYLHDRSSLAMDFAAARLRESPNAPSRIARLADFPAVDPDLLVVSHCLGELDDDGLAVLLDLVRRSHRVLWVEPGSQVVSRQMSELRDRLRTDFVVLAPCPHQERCSALRASSADWCHHFAKAPAAVFQDAEFLRAAKTLGIDLRSLPYQFLLLARPADLEDERVTIPRHGTRLIGRPTVHTKEASGILCAPEGLRPFRIAKSAAPDLWRALKKRPESVRDRLD